MDVGEYNMNDECNVQWMYIRGMYVMYFECVNCEIFVEKAPEYGKWQNLIKAIFAELAIGYGIANS